MITIISSTSAAHRIVKRLDKQKYQLLFLFSDYIEYKAFGDFEKIKVGKNTCKGLGCGSDIIKGKAVIKESLDDILNHIKGDIVFVVGCAGHGISGGMPILTNALIKEGKKAIVLTTNPFIFEGFAVSNASIVNKALRNINDNYYEINYSIDEMPSKVNSLRDAFEYYDDVIYNKLLKLLEAYETDDV